MIILGVFAVCAAAVGSLVYLRSRAPSSAATPLFSNDDDDADGDEELAPPSNFEALLRTTVVLLNAPWDTCTVDGIRETWTRFVEKTPLGFSAVCAGRHRVIAKGGTPNAEREVRLDFVLYPGEVMVRRFASTPPRFMALSPDNERNLAQQARDGGTGQLEEALISYRTTLGIARAVGGGLKSPDRVLRDVQTSLRELLARLTADNAEELRAHAEALGERLIGIPLRTRDLAMLRECALAASRSASDSRIAKGAVGLGLAILPGEPHLLVALAACEESEGALDKAALLLEEAAPRTDLFDAATAACFKQLSERTLA